MAETLKELPKVGDKVRYLGGEDAHTHEMVVGGIYEVINVKNSRGVTEATIEVGGDKWFIYGEDHDLGSDLDKYELVESIPEDVVNSPQHYKRGKFETIEVIEHITAGYDVPFVAYCVGNAVKYIDRAPYKHESPEECLRKAAWYLTRAADSVGTSK